jgi:general secretion pathway protein K
MKKTYHLRRVLENEKGGVALILVLWVMVILVAIVGEFSYSMRTEVNITRNFKEEEEAYQLALAGIERAKIEILSAKDSSYVYLNEDGILIFEKGDEEPVREGKLETGVFSYTIKDEDGKLNINNASRAQLRYIVSTTTGLEPQEIDTVVDSIIDWRDTNDLHMLNGAEEDYYRSLEKLYSCKDGPFYIIEELLLVRGVTPEIFFGSHGEEEEKENKGLIHYLTTWDVNRININTAPREVLEAVFGITAAENILAQREIGPLTTSVVGGKVKSEVFTIISTGATINGKIKRSVKATLRQRNGRIEVLYWNDNFIG